MDGIGLPIAAFLLGSLFCLIFGKIRPSPALPAGGARLALSVVHRFLVRVLDSI
jgi:hypothetical protein